MQDDNTNRSNTKKIVSYLWSFLKNALSNLSVLSVLAGLLIGYVLSRPRERSYIKRIADLELKNRRKQDDLQVVVQRLKQEIDVSRAAVQHNAQLATEQDRLEKELKTVVVDKEKLKRELKECENTVTECRNKIQQLEDQLQSKHDELSNIQQVYKTEQQTNKDHVTRQEQLTIEIQNLEQTNKDLQHKLAITEETQRVLEYIISKASPELAKTVMQELRQLQQ